MIYTRHDGMTLQLTSRASTNTTKRVRIRFVGGRSERDTIEKNAAQEEVCIVCLKLEKCTFFLEAARPARGRYPLKERTKGQSITARRGV